MRLYHYTSLDALTGIVQKGGLCIRGTRYDSMNDPMDCKYAEETVLPEFGSVSKKKATETGQKKNLFSPTLPRFLPRKMISTCGGCIVVK